MIYALNQDERLVHVDSVPNGLKCNCHCPSCGEQLSARQGKKRKHSFSHASHNESKCAYGYQTSLHLLAKEVFKEGCSILLPPVRYDKDAFTHLEIDSKDYNEIQKEVSGAYKFLADSVELEKRYDKFIPDIVLHYKNRSLVVEIYVTHSVDDEKKEKIKASGVSAVEFDLSQMDRAIDKECLRSVFETGENCNWIYNEKGEKATLELVGQIGRRIEKRKLAEQQKKQIEENKKKILIQKYGGNFKYYKIYYKKMDFGPVRVIYNPPCEKAIESEGSRLKKVDNCYRCPYFVKYETEQDVTGFDSPKRLLCQRQRFDA